MPASPPPQSELDVLRYIENVRLDDPATDPAVWCEQFKAWRDCLHISSQHALEALKLNVPKGHLPIISLIHQRWLADGNAAPETDETWDTYFAHVMTALPLYLKTRSRVAPLELDRMWQQLVQGDLAVHQYAGQIATIAAEFERLDPPVKKTPMQLVSTFLAGAKPALRLYLTGYLPLYRIEAEDNDAAALEKYNDLVQFASSYEAKLSNLPAQAEHVSRSDSLTELDAFLSTLLPIRSDSSKEAFEEAWRKLEQGDLTVQQYALRIAAMKDKLGRLDPPVTKTIPEILSTFLAGVKPAVRLHLTGYLRRFKFDAQDDELTAIQKYCLLVELASGYETKPLKTESADTNPRCATQSSNGHLLTSKTPDNETKMHSFEHTLCRVYASGRTCRYGKKCKRVHMSAKEFMRSHKFAQQSKKEQHLIMEIARSGAMPAGDPAPAPAHPAPQSVNFNRNRASRGNNADTRASEMHGVRARLDDLQRQLTAIVNELGHSSPSRSPPDLLDLEQARRPAYANSMNHTLSLRTSSPFLDLDQAPPQSGSANPARRSRAVPPVA